MTTLETERLHLRQFRLDDFEDFAAYHTDAELARFVGGACDRGEAWRRMAAIVGHWTLRGYGFWALEEKESGRFAGCCGLWFPEGWPELELGYWLMRDMHGKGYATEAARRSRLFAFERLNAKTLVSYIDPENAPSIRVAERLSCQREETIDLAGHGPHHVYRHPDPR